MTLNLQENSLNSTLTSPLSSVVVGEGARVTLALFTFSTIRGRIRASSMGPFSLELLVFMNILGILVVFLLFRVVYCSKN